MVRLRFVAGGRVTAAMGRHLAAEADLNKASAQALTLGCTDSLLAAEHA